MNAEEMTIFSCKTLQMTHKKAIERQVGLDFKNIRFISKIDDEDVHQWKCCLPSLKLPIRSENYNMSGNKNIVCDDDYRPIDYYVAIALFLTFLIMSLNSLFETLSYTKLSQYLFDVSQNNVHSDIMRIIFFIIVV